MRTTKEDLLDVITEASYRLHIQIKEAYNNGNLNGYLASIGMSDLIPKYEPSVYDTNPDGKILIVGETKIKENEIYGCLKEYGLSKERIELQLGFDKAKNFSFRHLQYNPNYRLILFGPIPHSGVGKGEKSSILTQIEEADGYPKVIRLMDEHGLKLTKASLKRAISAEIESGYILASH